MTAIGAIIGLCLAIFLITRKISPAYSLILGALVGGLSGGLDLPLTVKLMIEGVKDISPAIIRIITAGVLAGALIKSGAATKIAETIITSLGEKKAILAIALSAMLLTAIGVFIDVAIITVAPIALAIGKKVNLSKMAILLAMSGGGKAGNVISPNPNTIAVTDNFHTSLSAVMWANIIPAIIGLVITIWITSMIRNKGEQVEEIAEDQNATKTNVNFLAAIAGPLFTIFLLALRPIAGISIDPLVALPAGGIVGIIAMGKTSELKVSVEYGLQKMSGVAILLIGTGTIAGIVKHSSIKDVILATLEHMNISEHYIAPIAGALMSGATSSTTAGATIASAAFSGAILAAGISAVSAAAMTNAGATIFDHLPHGSYFHATAGATSVSLTERFKLIPYETAIAVVITIVSTIVALF